MNSTAALIPGNETETDRDGALPRVLYWQILHRDQGLCDHVVCDVVLPAMESLDLPPTAHWHLLRYLDERGPHVRVRVVFDEAPDPETVQYLDTRAFALFDHGLARVLSRDDLEPEPRLAATPAHLDLGGRGTGVHAAVYEPELAKYGSLPGVRIAERVWASGTDAVARLLPPLRCSRIGRVAAAAALSEIAVEHAAGLGVVDDPVRFWEEFGAFWSGGTTPQGRRVLARAARFAERIGLASEVADRRADPDLVRTGRELAADTVAGCAAGGGHGVEPELLLSHHAHLQHNRMGAAPQDEPLIAAALAQRAVRPGARAVG